MEIKGEIKAVGDNYEGFYSCGMTMQGSETMAYFTKSFESKERTVYISERGLEMTVEHRQIEGSLVTEIITTVVNTSDSDITLEMMTSFEITGIPADRVHRIQSFWSSEGRVKSESITDLNLEYSWGHFAYRVEKFGNVGSMPVRKYFPFVALEDSKSGEFTAVSLYTASSWQIEITTRKDELVTLSGGIADRDFGHWTKTLKPGESFTAPKAHLAQGNSLLDVCDKLVKAQKPNISPIDNHMGIVFNEYCTTWGHPTHDNIKRIADKIADKGIQYLVMDSGWYGEEGNWWDCLGQWDINRNRFPNGLKETTDYIRSKGMVPGIWFELEVVAKGSEFYNKTEYLVMKDGIPLTVGDRRFLDMENPLVIEHLTDKVIGLLKREGYGYIKVDYNDTMGIGCDGEDGFGENLRRKVEATKGFFSKMTNEVNGLVIELCSAGGHRLEPSMLELSSQASFSDAHETTAIPIIAANLQRVMPPEQSQIWAVMRKDATDERIYYLICATLFGRMGLSGDIYDLSDKQWDLISEGISFYNDAATIIQNGRTVLIECDAESYNNPMGAQLSIREYGNRKLYIFHRFENSPGFDEYMEVLNLGEVSGKIIRKYGNADRDFSAIAFICEE